MWRDWNFWLALVTAVTAVVALVLNSYQIRLSNKQHLFDRRLNDYMVAAGLVSLYKDNRALLMRKREDEPQFAIDQEFLWLTNNSYMESQIEAISHPLTQPYHKNFLKKREDLRALSTEIGLIFDGKPICIVSLYRTMK